MTKKVNGKEISLVLNKMVSTGNLFLPKKHTDIDFDDCRKNPIIRNSSPYVSQEDFYQMHEKVLFFLKSLYIKIICIQ